MEMMGFQDSFSEDVFSSMFYSFDSDGSGHIEKEELKLFINNLTKP